MKAKLSPLKVMKSNAGYYIGQTEIYPDGSEAPYCRKSGYYPFEEIAQRELENKTYVEHLDDF